jgi:beta-mannosidase
MEKLIHDAAASHQNMLRVWGGGLYEEERFYDLCDRYGILVWQDFIFSCSIYALDQPDFVENVRQEVLDNVRRLRHRASLALWCGNNEMEWGWESWGWSKLEHEDQIVAFLESTPSLRSFLGLLRHRQVHPEWKTLRQAYDTFFYETLPRWVAGLDPDTPYWPSSPSSDSHFVDVNGVHAGDTHNWEVWHGNRPFEAYREHNSRFVSEFGFQSLPALDTVRTYADEPDWNMTSYIMEHHQRNEAGNRKIITYMGDHFRLPKDFPSLVYLTQLLQAEAVRSGVEYWRRNMVCTSGALYWQLNDCWPVASWASLDYYGRWKALHYAAKRFFAPLLLSVEDEGARLEVHATSDLREAWRGEVHWSLENLSGEVSKSGVEPVSAEPLADTLVATLDFSEDISDANRRQVVLVCELRQGEERLALSVVPFAPDKHLEISDPGLVLDMSLEAGLLVVQVGASTLARFVELSLEGVDAVFSDNYFDLPAGRQLRLTTSLPENWSLERAQAALKVRSLYDSF